VASVAARAAVGASTVARVKAKNRVRTFAGLLCKARATRAGEDTPRIAEVFRFARGQAQSLRGSSAPSGRVGCARRRAHRHMCARTTRRRATRQRSR